MHFDVNFDQQTVKLRVYHKLVALLFRWNQFYRNLSYNLVNLFEQDTRNIFLDPRL